MFFSIMDSNSMADHCGYNGRCPGPSFYYLFFFFCFKLISIFGFFFFFFFILYTLYQIFRKDPNYIQKACQPEGSFKEPPDLLGGEIHQLIFGENKNQSDYGAYDPEFKTPIRPDIQDQIVISPHSSVLPDWYNLDIINMFYVLTFFSCL